MNTQSIKDFFRRNEKSTYTVLVIVLVLLALYFLMKGQGGNAPVVEDGDTKTPVVNESEMLSVANQAAGNSVKIEKLALTEKSWVVIHADKDGVPGQILGAGRFRPEDTSGMVELVIRPTEAGNTYYAMVHTDDGDDSFSYKTDVPTLVNDEPIMVSFQAIGDSGTATSTAQ